MVPKRGVEPLRPQWTLDPESSASASSATSARGSRKNQIIAKKTFTTRSNMENARLKRNRKNKEVRKEADADARPGLLGAMDSAKRP